MIESHQYFEVCCANVVWCRYKDANYYIPFLDSIHVDYACFIYDSTYESAKRVLDKMHHSAFRIATGAFRTTPIASLLVEADEPPLALR